jgi:hypothetical protein
MRTPGQAGPAAGAVNGRCGAVPGPLTAHSPAARSALPGGGTLGRARAPSASSSTAAKQLAGLSLGGSKAQQDGSRPAGRAASASASPYLTAAR